MHSHLLFFTLISLIHSYSVLAETKPTTPPQILATIQINNFLISPNGESLLIESSRPDIDLEKPEKSKWVYSTQFLSLKDKQSHEFPFSFRMPQWSSDGKWIIYLAPGDSKLSLWVTPVEQLKPQKILELERDIYTYKISSDGKRIAVAEIATKPSGSDETRIVYSQNSQPLYLPYILNIGDGFKVNKKPSPLLSSPLPLSEGFASPESLFAWSPNNHHLALLSQPQNEGSANSKNTQLAIVDVRNSKVLFVVHKNGTIISPIFSPNGKWLAYKTNAFPGKPHINIPIFEVGPSRVCLTRTDDYQEKCLAPTFNENPFILGWTKDSQSIAVAENYKTVSQLYELPINGNNPTSLLKASNQIISSGSVNPKTSAITYVGESFKMPQELYSLDIDTGKSEQISHLQDLPRSKNYPAEIINWVSYDGKPIEGILLLPEDQKEKIKLPLLVLLHDGPALAWGQNYLGSIWSPYLNISKLLEKGYAILAPNYRGSTGYGLDFRQANYKDLGGGDYKDVISGIDHVVKQGIIDPQRIAIWGWGYGGYLSTWAITQTDRFKTAVVGAGITDWISFVGQTTNPDLWEAYMGGYYWDDYDLWMSKSPSFHMQNVKTPTLIQWGYEDGLFHWVQAFELDYSLSDNNVPHTLLWYLNERHAFSNPYNVYQASKDLMEWLDKEMVQKTSPEDLKGTQK